MKKISAIIVTHNSEMSIDKVVESIPGHVKIIIVDSGSNVPQYLDVYSKRCTVLLRDNIGFCAANNLGYEYIDNSEYVLFLNPDAFLSENALEAAITYMELNKNTVMLTGPLLGFDFDHNVETGKYDSLGIFYKSYGLWYDRLQGEAVTEYPLGADAVEVPAACGALMLCRVSALNNVLLHGREVFRESYYMYKEDIELSMRISKAGGNIMMLPAFLAYHGRGWDRDRGKMPYWARKASAVNELKLNMLYYWRFLPYSLLKCIYVLGFERLILKLRKVQ